MSESDRWRVARGKRVRLSQEDPAATRGFAGGKRAGRAEADRLRERLEALQELLYANHSGSVLIVLQALDTGGKDGTIRHVFEGVNPQGVRVAQFRPPTPIEKDHDFLWRVHPDAPGRGEIAIFNRSHYEDVLAARVDGLVPPARWKTRYRAINEFERTLVEAGTVVLKFFLHISRQEQRERLEERLRDPTKHWKFSVSDLRERERWDAYGGAIEEMLERTTTAWAPWYLIPANKKRYRNWAVSTVLVEALEAMRLEWPKLPSEMKRLRIPP